MDLLRGKTLLKKTGDTFQEIPAVEALRNAQIVGFYFSAHWCVPCRSFTPCLVECYQELRAKKKPFEIVFVSADESPESAKTYMKEGHGEWMSTIFEDTDLHDSLAKTFAVIRIPQLIIVKRNGQMITANGCRDVKEFGVDAFASWAEGKSAVSSQEHIGIDEDLLDRLNKQPAAKVRGRLGASKPELIGGATCADGTGECGVDEMSKSLEKAGIHTSNVGKDNIKSNPTRMLTIRDVEKNATESSATSSGRKYVKAAGGETDKGAIPKRVVMTHKEREPEDGGAGGVQKEAAAGGAAASSKKAVEVHAEGGVKARTAMGEGGSSEAEKTDKSGKNELQRKRKRHAKKRAVLGKEKEKDKDESTKKSSEQKLSDS